MCEKGDQYALHYYEGDKNNKHVPWAQHGSEQDI